MSKELKEEGNNQELMQSSTTPEPGPHMESDKTYIINLDRYFILKYTKNFAKSCHLNILLTQLGKTLAQLCLCVIAY